MDGTVEIDPERRLALAYVPAARRPALHALWMLDTGMGSLVASGRQPMLTQIKLAWWRDALAALDREPAPPEPVLQEVFSEVLSCGVTGAEASEMIVGWEYLLDPDALGDEELRSYAHLRGALLFRLSARLLGVEADASVESAGEGWALADLARRSSRTEERRAALAKANARLSPGLRWPSRLRPLGMIAALARRDARRGEERLEPAGAPVRLGAMLVHRLTGR